MPDTPNLPSGTITFLFTDIEGSTRRWEEHREAMQAALQKHDDHLRHAIESNSGVVFKTGGDAFYAAFASAEGAVRAALDGQRRIAGESWGELGEIRVRMALYTGVAELRDDDYFGPPLNRVSRLLSAGAGGQILLSGATVHLVQDHLPTDAGLKDLGEHQLRDLASLEHIYQVTHPELSDEFPPLKVVDIHPNNLPAQVTSFVGREKELGRVKELLSTSRLLTLTGGGGHGKTRLSIQAAADLLDHYPDGVWFVDLAPLAQPELVVQTTANAMGLREVPGQPLLNALLIALGSKHVLILLDNCEHLVEACARLVDTLIRTCPHVTVLATSREGLAIAGETAWRVPPLGVPDPTQLPSIEQLTQYEAVRLFIDRACAVRPDFSVTNQNAPAVAEICHRLDGIPLAIELAAARVKVLGPDLIAARLDDRFRLLTGGSRTALPRQQALRTLVDWSYDLLSESEKALLRRVSIFAGGWTLEEAERVCADDRIQAYEILDLLSSLVEKSLVVADEQSDGSVRYRLLETLREYGRERLAAAREVEALGDQHAAYFVSLAEEAEAGLTGPEQAGWLRRLEAEHADLRTTLDWLLERDDAETVVRLAGGPMWRFWWLRGYLTEGRRRAETILQLPELSEPGPLRAKALFVAGQLALWQGDYGPARLLLQESLTIARQSGTSREVALALTFLGRVARDQGDDAALACGEESVELFRQVGDEWGCGVALHFLGLAVARHDPAAALPLFEESAALFEKLGDRWDLAMPLRGLGIVAYQQGDYPAAADWFQQCAALFREREDEWSLAMALHDQGYVALSQGNFRLAFAWLGESLRSWRRLGNKRGAVTCLAGLAGVVARSNRPAIAARLFGAAESIGETDGIILEPTDLAVYEQNVIDARERLGADAFVEAWTDGRAMSLDAAVEYALELESPAAQMSSSALNSTHVEGAKP